MTKTGKQVTQNISTSAKMFGVKSFHIGISKSTCNFFMPQLNLAPEI